MEDRIDIEWKIYKQVLREQAEKDKKKKYKAVYRKGRMSKDE